MSQNVVLYLQNVKKMGKKRSVSRLVIICNKIDLQIIAMCAHFN